MDIHYTKSTKREKMWVDGGGGGGSYQNRMVTDEVVGVERSADGFMDKAYSAN